MPVQQPPGFVLFLAGVYRFAGHDFLTPKILLVLMVSAIAAGTWWLGCCYVGVWEGLVAGGLVVVSPMFRAYAATLQYEIPVTLLFLVTCLLLFRGLRATPLRRSLLLFSAAACAAAACALTRESFLAVFPLLPIAVWTNWSGTRRHRLAVVCVMSGLFCFLVGCWIAWQYHTHGQLVPISNKGPFNFWIGNNPNATGLYNLHFGPLGRPWGWAFIQEQPADALAFRPWDGSFCTSGASRTMGGTYQTPYRSGWPVSRSARSRWSGSRPSSGVRFRCSVWAASRSCSVVRLSGRGYGYSRWQSPSWLASTAR